jgi:hypothetical protein
MDLTVDIIALGIDEKAVEDGLKKEIQDTRTYFENQSNPTIWYRRISDIALSRILKADPPRWAGQVTSWSQAEFRLKTEYEISLKLEDKFTSSMVLVSLSREKSKTTH